MKLDATVMRTMNRQDFRVLAAIESGMKSRELVPVKIICSLANLRHGGVHKILSSLLRDKLVSHDQSCGYDGYRLTNAGYDILALQALKVKKIVGALGQRIGTGKESDVYLAATPEGKQIVLKFHRLGRTSFRDVKSKRDYFNYIGQSKDYRMGGIKQEQPQSWLFLSRISALKEYSFMKALHGERYPTPTPLAHDRHIVAMSLVRGVPLYQLHTNRVSAEQAQSIFEQSAHLATRLAQHGLVHCDLNEYNLVVDLSGTQAKNFSEEDAAGDPYVRHSGMSVEIKGALSAHGPLQNAKYDATGELITEAPLEPAEYLSNCEPKPVVTLIDFPQMVSTKHPNAKELYERDFVCLKKFFEGKLKLSPPDDQSWEEWIPSFDKVTTMLPAETLISPDDQDEDDAATYCTSTTTKTLASKAQLRIDQQLQASGYSVEDSNRQMQLYYHSSRTTSDNLQTLQESDNIPEATDEEEQEHDSESDSSNDRESDEGVVIEDDYIGDKFNGGNHMIQSVFLEFPEGSVEAKNDLDNFDEKEEQYPEQQSVATFHTQLTYEQAEEIAKERVRKAVQLDKRKQRQQGAYRKKNANKTFHKGKRIYAERYT